MDADLPLDSENGQSDGPLHSLLPIHLRPWCLAMVWVGGTAGTAARYLISAAVPNAVHVPVGTVGINVVGAFLLGVLVELLARRGEDAGRRRLLRLLLGTGFLGGFTTYSALAVDTVSLVRAGSAGHGLGYALLTLLLGGLGSLAGMALGSARRRRPPARSSEQTS